MADRLVRKVALDAPARCLAWAPDGCTLLVGLGGDASGARHPKDGAFLLLDATTLSVRAEGRDSRHWVRCAKFSPDGAAFALGGADQKVYIYDTQTARLRCRCLAHGGPILAVDWSTDSTHVQSDATDGEHLYHAATDGALVRLPSTLRDVQFADWSCVYGWPAARVLELVAERAPRTGETEAKSAQAYTRCVARTLGRCRSRTQR